MSTRPVAAPPPPPGLMEAMQRVRADDMAGALAILERHLPAATDRPPLLALAGHAALHLRLTGKAITFLEELLALRPDDRATRANLANALIAAGRPGEALDLVSGADHPALARIEGYIQQQAGNGPEAVAAYARAVAADPADLASWNNLGNLHADAERHDEAIEAFERAITIAPGEVQIYLNLARTLAQAERHDARLKVLRDAAARDPADGAVQHQLGLACTRLDDFEGAIAAFRRALEIRPGAGETLVELGMIYESMNRLDDLAALSASVAGADAPAEAAFLHAWVARREGRFDEAAELAAAVPDSIPAMRRQHLIAGIEDRRGNTDAAFAAYSAMNRASVEALPPEPGPSFREEVERELARWTDGWRAAWRDYRPAQTPRDPVFLVGFPRSGTTLLDTMLMGQPGLSVLEERPMMARVGRMVGDQPLPDLLPARIEELRAAYFELAAEAGWDSGKWLVDKHPLNMQRVPLIHRLFPDARIILAERHPADVVLSCFMANFQPNHAMRSFTSLDEAARTYDTVWRAWERGVALFRPDLHRVRYERLIEDAEGTLRPLVEWLGLEWDDAMLDHQGTAEKRGRVRTASYSQIGEQLYTRAAGRWRRYEQHLAPVLPVLLPWAERMGYPDR